MHTRLSTFPLAELYSHSRLKAHHDALLLVCPDPATVKLPEGLGFVPQLSAARKADKTFDSGVTFYVHDSAPGGRVIMSPVGSTNDYTDDVRRYADAAAAAIRRARAAGSVRPLLYVPAPGAGASQDNEYAKFREVALLGALQEAYVPLQRREIWKKLGRTDHGCIQEVTLAVESPADEAIVARVSSLEHGRALARDIGGSDPERMTSLRCAEHILKSFKGTEGTTKITVIEDRATLEREYPLLGAVARASQSVERHRPCVVRIEYRSPDQEAVKENLFFVGKGITYDTGGADVKAGGVMRGMSRDKCGAAAVAGLLRTAASLQPRGVNITAELAFVRNSIGSESYVSDEVIVSRAGVPVLVGNTDAEGRMVMSDPLAKMREEVLAQRKAGGPHIPARIFTVATLTGHVIRAWGPYAAIVPNGAAIAEGVASRLQIAGDLWGDMFELSPMRREDFDFGAPGPNAPEAIISSNSKASTMTNRGHQSPAAFMSVVSGIGRGRRDAGPEGNFAYCHLDIAGAAEVDGVGLSLGHVTGAPIVALSAAFFE